MPLLPETDPRALASRRLLDAAWLAETQPHRLERLGPRVTAYVDRGLPPAAVAAARAGLTPAEWARVLELAWRGVDVWELIKIAEEMVAAELVVNPAPRAPAVRRLARFLARAWARRAWPRHANTSVWWQQRG